MQGIAWDFGRLPVSEHRAVLDALQNGDVRALIAIHDKYELSPYNYCCSHAGLLAWFEHGIKTGAINARKKNGDKGGV